MIDGRTVRLASYATDQFAHSQRRLNRSAARYGVDETISFGAKDIADSEFYRENEAILRQPRGAGYWLWKPHIILEMLKRSKEGDVVVYSDAGIEVIGDLTPLLSIAVERDSLLLFCDGGQHRNRVYTKRDCFVLMGCDGPQYWDGCQCMASFQVYPKNARSIEFVSEWLRYARDARVITDMENSCGLENLPEFKDHRHDQSILTLLAQREGVEVFRDPTQWGNGLKAESFRVAGEFLCHGGYSDRPYRNSPYPTLLNHHRNQPPARGLDRIRRRLGRLFAYGSTGADQP